MRLNLLITWACTYHQLTSPYQGSKLNGCIRAQICHVWYVYFLSLYRNKKDDIPLKVLLEGLNANIDKENVSKFNVNRGHLWDCSLRGFRRSSFSPHKRLSVHFTDDVGTMEGAIDEGGPRREFLRLLTKALQSNHNIFDGQIDCRLLRMSASGEKILF